jgi:hypothetical protein
LPHWVPVPSEEREGCHSEVAEDVFAHRSDRDATATGQGVTVSPGLVDAEPTPRIARVLLGASGTASTLTLVAAVIAALASLASAYFAGRTARGTEREKWQREQRLPLYSTFLRLTRVLLEAAEASRQAFDDYGLNKSPQSAIVSSFVDAYIAIDEAAAELDLVASDRVRSAATEVRMAAHKILPWAELHPVVGGLPVEDYDKAYERLFLAEPAYVKAVRLDLSSRS